LLPAKELAPHYGDVTWLFVSRNFKDDEKDREAARTHDRFGITSWPQMVIFDPRDDRVLLQQPRDLQGFLAGLKQCARSVPAAPAGDRAAADRVAEAVRLRGAGKTEPAKRLLQEVAKARDGSGVWLHARELLREMAGGNRAIGEQLEDPDVRERAIAVERILDLAAGEAAKWREPVAARLRDRQEHLTVRLRALRVLAKADPAAVAASARELLATDNDPFRFAVLEVLQGHPDPQLTSTLVALFEQAGREVESHNPNVLRMHAAKCLGACGDAGAVPALAKASAAGDPRNALSGTLVDALAAIGARTKGKDRQDIVAALVESLPKGLEDAGLDGFGERGPRMLAAAVDRVHEALQMLVDRELPAPPAKWTRQAREQHLAKLQRLRR
jgi:hypothetical protein